MTRVRYTFNQRFGLISRNRMLIWGGTSAEYQLMSHVGDLLNITWTLEKLPNGSFEKCLYAAEAIFQDYPQVKVPMRFRKVMTP